MCTTWYIVTYAHTHGPTTTVKRVTTLVTPASFLVALDDPPAPRWPAAPGKQQFSSFLPSFPPSFLPAGSSATTPSSASLRWPSRGCAPCVCCKSPTLPSSRETCSAEAGLGNLPLPPAHWAETAPHLGPLQGQLCPKVGGRSTLISVLTESKG